LKQYLSKEFVYICLCKYDSGAFYNVLAIKMHFDILVFRSVNITSKKRNHIGGHMRDRPYVTYM